VKRAPAGAGTEKRPDDLAQLEETFAVLSDREALDIRKADAAYARGDAFRGVEAVRTVGR